MRAQAVRYPCYGSNLVAPEALACSEIVGKDVELSGITRIRVCETTVYYRAGQEGDYL